LSRLITIDFETYYAQEYSLSKISTEAYIRDSRFEVIGVGIKIDDGEPQWYAGELRAGMALAHIKPDDYVLAHNTAFDGAILAWRYNIRPKFYLDTLSMARPVTGATVGGSLAALAKKFMLGEKGTEVVMAKGMRLKDFSPNELAEYGKYCLNDVQLTYNLFHVLKQWSTSREMYLIDLMLRMFIDPVLELDREVLYAHLLQVQAKKEELMLRIQHGVDDLMSNPKLAAVLESYGVEVPMKISAKTQKSTYAFSKQDQAFKDLLDHPNPDVQALVAARLGVKSTLEETRTKAFIEICKRGTLAILLNYYGAHTGRASGGDGINLQNLPRGGALRRAMKAPFGHKIVAGDSSQIEARIVAWWAGQDDLVQDFANGVDIYSNFATDVYGRPINRKRKDPDGSLPDFIPGFVGKTCILGLGFGMGPPKLRRTLKIGQGGVSVDLPETECERIVKQVYRTKYSMIVALWKQCQKALEAVAKGHEAEIGVNLKLRWDQDGIHLPNGMLIRYNNLRGELRGDGMEYLYDTRKGPVKIYGAKVVENVVQALARIVVFNQMCAVSQQLRSMDRPEEGKRFTVVLTVHDEIVIVVPEEWAKAAEVMLENNMKVVPNWAKGLPITCEVGAADCYADC
jgi:DNA polymerase I-like protein with 3'-5' exonuclease and polymerase domains